MNSIRWILSTCHKILCLFLTRSISPHSCGLQKNCMSFRSVYFFLEVSPGIRLGVTNWIAMQGKHSSPLLNVSLILLVLIHRWGGCVACHLNLIIRKALLNRLCWTHIIKLPFWREAFVREVISIRSVSGGFITARNITVCHSSWVFFFFSFFLQIVCASIKVIWHTCMSLIYILEISSFLFRIYGILLIIWDTFWNWQFSALVL